MCDSPVHPPCKERAFVPSNSLCSNTSYNSSLTTQKELLSFLHFRTKWNQNLPTCNFCPWVLFWPPQQLTWGTWPFLHYRPSNVSYLLLFFLWELTAHWWHHFQVVWYPGWSPLDTLRCVTETYQTWGPAQNPDTTSQEGVWGNGGRRAGEDLLRRVHNGSYNPAQSMPIRLWWLEPKAAKFLFSISSLLPHFHFCFNSTCCSLSTVFLCVLGI